MDIKTPFSDRIEKSPVPTSGSGSGKIYEQGEFPGAPGRTGGDIKELYRDNPPGSGAPGTSGPYKTPFKDSVG